MEIGRIAVDQLAIPVVILRQEPVSTVVDLLYRIVTFKSGQCPRVEVNANIVQCWGLTLHDRPAAQVGLNIRCRVAASGR